MSAPETMLPAMLQPPTIAIHAPASAAGSPQDCSTPGTCAVRKPTWKPQIEKPPTSAQ